MDPTTNDAIPPLPLVKRTAGTAGTTTATMGARFTLRKRAIRSKRDMVNISSYNSDFLSGLFADVAKANVLSELGIPSKRGSDLISQDSAGTSDTACAEEVSLAESSPSKKSRTSLTRSLSRARSSVKNLERLNSSLVQSPKGINEFFGSCRADATTKTTKRSLGGDARQDSLAFQLSCVAGDEEEADRSGPAEDAAEIAFPNLPATVSDSSCGAALTRANLVRQASTPENENKECFGWFVDLDDNHTAEARPGLPYTVSSDDLAFQAPTAPKRVNDEAELEWAKAADTVDDVLGDFF